MKLGKLVFLGLICLGAQANYTGEWFKTATVDDVRAIADLDALCSVDDPKFGKIEVSLFHCAAAFSPRPEVVKSLLDAGVDINAEHMIFLGELDDTIGRVSLGMPALFVALGLQENPDIIDVFFDPRYGLVVPTSISMGLHGEDGGLVATLKIDLVEAVEMTRGIETAASFHPHDLLVSMAKDNSNPAVLERLLTHICPNELIAECSE